MHQFFLLLSLLLMCCQAFGTCIVIIRKDNEILIGTDSRNKKMRSTGEVTGTSDNYCKVRKAGNFYYGLVGFDDVNQIRFAEEVAKEVDTVEGFAKLFADKMGPHYAGLLDTLRYYNPNEYHQTYSSGKVIGQTPIFRFEKGVARLIVITFFNIAMRDEPVHIRATYSVDQEYNVLGSAWYRHDRNPNLHEELNRLRQTDHVKYIKKIIDYESEKVPTDIGGPKHVWRLKENEISWVNPDSKEPTCLK